MTFVSTACVAIGFVLATALRRLNRRLTAWTGLLATLVITLVVHLACTAIGTAFSAGFS